MKRLVASESIMKRRVVLYLRLSKEDLEKPSKESISESIKNQKKMLVEEVEKHPDWRIVNIYCDEDFSGVGTYRPDFERLIKACENGDVDIVLCKSQSRFSRDMEVIEKYLHNKFILWNVRFISIIDNADTDDLGNKKTRQINALVNEWFLEDLSDNIKATFRTKWKDGECTSAFAKYGLMKDPKNKNHLIIDPVASCVLKQIGDLFLAGCGQKKLAKILNEKKIPSPYEYKLMNGCKLRLPVSKNFENTSIARAGEFVIRVFFYNDLKQILRKIKSIYFLGIDIEQNFNAKFQMKVRSISEDLELFYTTNQLVSFKNIDKIDYESNLWKKLKLNEDIPKNVTYIGSSVLVLDRLRETGFELEVKLSNNKEKNIYQLFSKSLSLNTNLFFKYEIRKKYKWNGTTIYHMLRDEAYHGTLTQGKTRRISYKNHRCIQTKKEDWVSSISALEKIFDDETWVSIQNKLAENGRSGKVGTRHIFAGKIYCDSCGRIFHKNCSYDTHGNKTEYFICKDRQNKWANCDNKKSIKYDVIKKCILDAINKQFNQFYDVVILNNLYDEYLEKDLFKRQVESLLKEKNDIMLFFSKKKDTFKKLYEDRVNGIIDDNDFSFLRLKYKEEVDKISERLSQIETELNGIKIEQKNLGM